MNRLEILILSVLSANEAFDKVTAMTAREIADAEDLGYKDNTILKKIAVLASMGYLDTGYKEGKARTLYITDAGRQALKQLQGGERHEK